MVEQLPLAGSKSDRGPYNISSEIAPGADGELSRDGTLSLPSHTALVADAYSEGAFLDPAVKPAPFDDHLRSILGDTLSGEFGQFQIILDGAPASEDGSSPGFSI